MTLGSPAAEAQGLHRSSEKNFSPIFNELVESYLSQWKEFGHVMATLLNEIEEGFDLARLTVTNVALFVRRLCVLIVVFDSVQNKHLNRSITSSEIGGRTL